MDMSSLAQRASQALREPLSSFTTPGQAGWLAGKGALRNQNNLSPPPTPCWHLNLVVVAWCPGSALLRLQALCVVGVGQGPETQLSVALVASFSFQWTREAVLTPGVVGAGAAGRISPIEPGLMLSSLRVSFIQQIFIVHVPCSGPGFRCWEYSSHLTELAGREEAVVRLANGEIHPE